MRGAAVLLATAVFCLWLGLHGRAMGADKRCFLVFRNYDMGPAFRLEVPSDGHGGADWKRARMDGVDHSGGRWECH